MSKTRRMIFTLSICIIVLAFVVAVPFAVRDLFRRLGKSGEWTAGDLLSFFTGVAASLGTIGLGWVAIQQNKQANRTNDNLLALTKESERRSVLPYLGFTCYVTKITGDVLGSFILRTWDVEDSNDDLNNKALEDSLERKDVLLAELIVSFEGSGFNIRDELTNEQRKRIDMVVETKTKGNIT